jgi:hypothetical protein
MQKRLREEELKLLRGEQVDGEGGMGIDDEAQTAGSSSSHLSCPVLTEGLA